MRICIFLEVYCGAMLLGIGGLIGLLIAWAGNSVGGSVGRIEYVKWPPAGGRGG